MPPPPRAPRAPASCSRARAAPVPDGTGCRVSEGASFRLICARLYIPVAAFTLWLCFYSVCFLFLFGCKYLTRPRGAARAEPQRGGDWPVSGRTGPTGSPGPAWGFPSFSSWSLLLGGPANRQDVRGSGAGPRPPAPRSASVPSEAGEPGTVSLGGQAGSQDMRHLGTGPRVPPGCPSRAPRAGPRGPQAPVSRIRQSRLCCPPPRGSQRVGHV